MEFNFRFLAEHLDVFGQALLNTIYISIIGMAGSLVVGIVAGAAGALRVPVLRHLVRAYVGGFRNTPLIVQIFFLYFAVPVVGPTLSGFTVGWLSLTLWGGAYQTENFRAAFEAVEPVQVEASRALGFTQLATFWVTILPLGWRTALPSVTNILISVFKNSSFMIAIGYPELTNTAYTLASRTFRVFEVFAAIGVIYLGLVWLFSMAARAMERRLAI